MTSVIPDLETIAKENPYESPKSINHPTNLNLSLKLLLIPGYSFISSYDNNKIHSENQGIPFFELYKKDIIENLFAEFAKIYLLSSGIISSYYFFN